MSRLLRVFLNADMRNGHDGLKQLAKTEKLDLAKLEPGEYVLFLNSARDRLKLFATDNIFAYLKLDRGRIDLRTLSKIPRAFSGSGKIDYDATLKEVLKKELLPHVQSD